MTVKYTNVSLRSDYSLAAMIWLISDDSGRERVRSVAGDEGARRCGAGAVRLARAPRVRGRARMRVMRTDCAALLAWLVCCAAALSTHKYSTRVVRTKYGPLRGIVVHSHPQVEAYLGVPYATPPLGSLSGELPAWRMQWALLVPKSHHPLYLVKKHFCYIRELASVSSSASFQCLLGVLGFLKTGAKGSAQGNFGLMDLVAGLHWLRENLPAFGGDPEKVTLMGHGTGAALANFLAVSPVARELLKRVILLSGSGLSSWALQREPLTIKRKVAEQTGCHGDLLEDDLAPCLRNKPLAELLAVKLEPPRFLPGFAPFVDGTVIVNPSSAQPPTDTSRLGAGAAAVTSAAGHELADFPHRELMFESYLEFNAQDLEFGFNESRRDRILRTFVRNAYYYHLNEIYSTLKNEYTDWDKPVQNPLSVRDATLERPGSVHGEELPFYLGMPLSQNPNDPSATPPPSPIRGDEPRPDPDDTPYWDTYDTINQLYMEISVVRPQSMSRAHVPHVVNMDNDGRSGDKSTPPPRSALPKPSSVPSTECPPNVTSTPPHSDDALLRRLASSHYQSYTAALTVTIAVGCFLLLLNVLIFAGIYHQRGTRPRRSKDDLTEAGSSSSSDNYDGKIDYEVRAFEGKGFGFECKSAHVPRGSKFDLRTLSDCGEPAFGEYSCYDEKHRAARRSLPDVSVGSVMDASSVVCIDTQKPDIQKIEARITEVVGRTSTFEPRVVDSSTQVKFGPLADGCDLSSETNGDLDINASGSGILRVPPAATTPAPPGIMKKRVQIQEISV
ncbi:unnamed protein product [Leptidea sinapis]|uniref:Carboxylesterase type B domain-containing protein n=1 Tax=Leptidea sinapis TaxID=189913 RepID=A0A5E4Q916_9NEOP|nr:unnamed protein product [Leptidea sinapis]